MAGIGLVLGGGGIVGNAFHAGVLAALQREIGWDPRAADLIVGTSAGSVSGTGLRLGVSPADMAAFATDSPMSPAGEAFFTALDRADQDLPAPSATDLLRGWRLPTAALLARSARRPWALRPAAAASTLLPAGRYDLQERTRILDELSPSWPEGLWICAARRDHGRRVVFGRPGSPRARLSAAVAASCAIPAYFAPVTIGTKQYVDGGVHSATNADALGHAGLDLVIVASPMSAAHGRSTRADAPVRWAMHRRLDREVRRLRDAGTEVIRIEPSASTLSVMGLNAMAEDRAAAVVEAAYADTVAHVATSANRFRLTALRQHDLAA
jgi:NTE family protein